MQASLEAIARGRTWPQEAIFISREAWPPLWKRWDGAPQRWPAPLWGQKAESGTFDVLLRPQAAAELLEYALIPALLADSVQKGRSVLAGRIGESIATERLVIADDGLVSGGIDSSAFDGEGCHPSGRF